MIHPPIQQLHNAIIYGKVPTLFVDFGKFSVEFLLHHTGKFSFSFTDNISILEKCVVINNVPGKDIVKTLPRPLFNLLLDMYRDFQRQSLPVLFENIPVYVKDNESRAQWMLAKAVGIKDILPMIDGQLNLFQRSWVVQNSIQDKLEQNNTITNVIEILKPWLDKELYTHLEERSANTRENVMFEFTEDVMDAEIRAKAKESAKNRTIAQDDFRDTIRIKENI